ncbi:MAG TPA: zinc transporter ZntB [Woeseiaceae bacterium]|nr:zinc transporter ZntB [Woeseiaceae bacterium]
MNAGVLPVESARAFDGRGGATVLGAAGIEGWNAAESALWVDVDLSNSASRDWLRRRAGIERAAIDALLAGETRPRALAFPSGVLLVVRGVNLNPGADPEDMVAVRIWLDSRHIITSRRRRVLSVDDVATALDAGQGPTSTGSFVVFLIGRLTERIGAVVEAIEDEIDDIELSLTEDAISDLRSRLGDLRRQIAAIRRFLAPQRDALDRLYRQPGEYFSDRESQELREEADRLTRQLEDLDLARERALVTHEELQNRIAQEQNQRVYLLSVVAAIFLPLTFVTGLLGMNVAGLPGTEAPYGFVVSAVTMVLLGIGLTLLFKWKNWI